MGTRDPQAGTDPCPQREPQAERHPWAHGTPGLAQTPACSRSPRPRSTHGHMGPPGPDRAPGQGGPLGQMGPPPQIGSLGTAGAPGQEAPPDQMGALGEVGPQAKRDPQARKDLGRKGTLAQSRTLCGQGLLGEEGPPGQVETPSLRSTQGCHKPWLALRPRLSRTPRPGGTPNLRWLCMRLCLAGHPLRVPTPTLGANSPSDAGEHPPHPALRVSLTVGHPHSWPSPWRVPRTACTSPPSSVELAQSRHAAIPNAAVPQAGWSLRTQRYQHPSTPSFSLPTPRLSLGQPSNCAAAPRCHTWERRGPIFSIHFCSPHSSIRPGLVCCAEQGKTGNTGRWPQLEPVQGRESPGAPHIPGAPRSQEHWVGQTPR